MRLLSLIFFLAMFAMGASNLKADPSDLSSEEALEALWKAPNDSSLLFAESVLNQISVAQIAAIIGDLTKRYGTFEGVQKTAKDNRFKIRTSQCEVPTQLDRDKSGRIIGILFQTPIRHDASLTELLDEAASFEGDVSYAVYKNGDLVAGHEISRLLAVGSAFKLVVLAELNDLIDQGDAAWSDVITLKSSHISLPSGRLHKMPPGSPFTLHTLAAAMISESDNTATDILIDFLGRDRLEQSSDIRPFLMTREFFQLKADSNLYKRYVSSALEGRRDILRSLENSALPQEQGLSELWLEHAEWHMSTASLCSCLEKTGHLEITQINPGVLSTADWRKIAYKGGSEGGVLNLTTRARDDRNNVYCISMTWNADRQIDHTTLTGLYGSIFTMLQTQE